MGKYDAPAKDPHPAREQRDPCIAGKSWDLGAATGTRLVGSLEEGKAADFLVLDPKDPPVGVSNDPWAQLVFAMSTRNIVSVVIGGRTVWEKGRFTGVDADAIDR